MKLQRIAFKNFGIFRDQVMDDINSGLVIIAGPNRAGKTTFMTALRYLGYGLPKKDFIPAPLTGQHDYSADVELTDLSRYNIHILGNSRPRVSPIGDQRDMEVEEIFNNLDALTYRQVFTISLDELRRIPEGLGSRDEQQLQIVLLGGGWVDALRLVKFQEDFDKRGHALGRKRGDKKVGEFKPYWEAIRKGIAERNEANKQLESYYLKKQELMELEDEIIPRMETELQNMRNELEILEIIKDHYDKYKEMLFLEEKLAKNTQFLTSYPEEGLILGKQLKREYDLCTDEYGECLREYSYAAGPAAPDTFLEIEDLLLAYQKDLSGWKEKLAGYRGNKQGHLDEKSTVEQKLVKLNAEWNDGPSILDAINTDLVNRGGLREAAGQYNRTKDKIEQIAPKKIQLQDNLNKKQKEKKQFMEKNNYRPIKLPLMAGLALLFVLLIAIFNSMASLAAGFLLSAALYLYFQSHQSREKELKNQLFLMEKEINDLREQLKLLETEEKLLRETLTVAGNELEKIVKLLRLPLSTPYSSLTDLYGEITNLKERYGLWQENEKKLKIQSEELKKIFVEISLLLGSLNQNIPDIDEDFSVSGKIFDAVEKAVGYLGLAQRLKKKGALKKEIEKKIIALLQKENPALQTPPEPASGELSEKLASFINRGNRHEELKKEEGVCENLRLDLESSLNIKRRREILLKSKPEENILPVYDQFFNAYSSLAEIDMEYAEIAGERETLKRQRESELERRAVLEKELRDLSSDERLQAAHQKISAAKNKLETLAEQYAIYRLAEFMVGEVHKTFVENTKGSILNVAGDIFKEITSGDCEKIDIPETQSIADPGLDFKVKQAEGVSPLSTHQLSRATREQLFLSVRLSRIRNIKPLPVIFDDSFVNFDPSHSRQAARLIAKMAETHQVFVLTCHPEFIDYLQDQSRAAQCWGLDNGKLSGPFDTFAEAVSLLNPQVG